METHYPKLEGPEGCKCPCCGECEKETLEHFLFKCRRYMKERLALVRRIRERLTLGEERDVEPLIRMVLGLDDVSTHKAEVQGVKRKSVKRDALPLPDSPNDSEAASRLTRALEKDTSPRRGGTKSDLSVGPARGDQVESGRVSTPGGVPKREQLVVSLSHPPTSFSAPVKVTSLPQVPGRKKNRQSGIDEFFKIATKCSDKDKDLSADKTSDKTSDKDKTLDKTGTRTRSRWTDSRRTVLDPSNRKRLRLVQERTWRDTHGLSTNDRSTSDNEPIESLLAFKLRNDRVAQGSKGVTHRQSPTDDEDSQTPEIIPLIDRKDTECQTLRTTGKSLPITGITPDKNDEGSRAVSTTASTTANSTFSTADSGDACQVSTHIAVDSRFRPCLLCKDPVDVRGSLRGFGDCSVIPRGSLGRRVIQRIYCADWRDIVKGSMRNGFGSVCTSSGENHGSDSHGRDNWVPNTGRKDCEEIQTPGIGCEKFFGERSELVGCEELAKYLQSTQYDRLTLFGIWSKGIASRPKRSATGKKSKAGRYGRNRRSTARSRSPAGQ